METRLHGGPQTRGNGGTSDGVQSELKAAASELCSKILPPQKKTGGHALAQLVKALRY